VKCCDVYRHICDNLDQRLRTARCREIRLHLALCSNCRAYLATLKRTVSLYRSVPSPRLPKAAHDRLIRTLRAHGCVPATSPGALPARSRRKPK
jgi:anti-sigma factor RsiW